MDSQLPIRPEFPSFLMGLTPSAPVGATLSPAPAGNGDVVYLFDATKLPAGSRAWIGVDLSSSGAVSKAVIPLIGTPSSAFAVAAGTVQGFTLVGGLYLAGIMENGSGTLACTLGFGV